MTTTQASRRYLQILLPAMLLFLAASFGIDWIDDNTNASQFTLAWLAIAPILLLLSTYWAQWRFLQEVDEYIRMIHVKALICGLIVVMTVATAWGYIEEYASIPSIGIFWLNPIFWMSYGVFATVITKLEEKPAK